MGAIGAAWVVRVKGRGLGGGMTSREGDSSAVHGRWVSGEVIWSEHGWTFGAIVSARLDPPRKPPVNRGGRW